MEALAEREDRGVANKALSECFPDVNGAVRAQILLGCKSCLEKAPHKGEWGLKAKLVLQGKLYALLQLQLGVVKVSIAHAFALVEQGFVSSCSLNLVAVGQALMRRGLR